MVNCCNTGQYSYTAISLLNFRLMTVLADGGKNEGVITGHKFKRAEIVHAQAKAKEYLMHVDGMLDDCFKSLANLTGVYLFGILFCLPNYITCVYVRRQAS